MEKKGFFDSLLTGFLSIVYSKDKKIERTLILLLFIGFIFRIIAAINLDFNADDAIYASQSAGIINSGILSTHSHPALFFYLNDLAYNFLGYTTLAARFIPLIAGTLLIIIVYLIGSKLFNKQVGLASAFFATFSNFMIKMTFTEHSALVFFLSFFAIYTGLLYLDNNEKKYLIITGILFGLSVLTKYNGFFFLFAFIVFAAYQYRLKKIENRKKGISSLLYLIGIVIIFSLPFLFFNQIIYSEKGLLDWQFAIVLKKPTAQALFSGLAGADKSTIESLLTGSTYANIFLPFKTDLILSLFFLLGIFFMFKSKQKVNLSFIFIILLIPFLLQSIGSTLAKHFEFMHIIFCIPAGLALISSKEIFSKKIFRLIIIALVALFLFNMYTNDYSLPSGFSSKSDSSQLKSFISNNVDSNDLIVFDDRIYTSRIFWLATPNNFLTVNQFNQFYAYNANLSANQLTNVDVYFVECLLDDCGWGIEKISGTLNDSSEEVFSQIGDISNEVHQSETDNPLYKVYKVRLPLNQQLVNSVKNSQSFFFAPYLYLNMNNYVFNYDYSKYPIRHNLGILIIKISMILTLVSFLYAIYLILVENNR